MKVKKVRKLLKWTNQFLTGLFIILLVSIAGIVISTKITDGEPSLFGYQFKTVLSGSMEPKIQTGSIITVKSIDQEERIALKEGDVITFQDENRLVTHRISAVTSTNGSVQYTTKGDNNDAADSNPVSAEHVVAVYKGLTIPYVGYFIRFSQSPNGSLLFMIIPGILMVMYSIYTLWRTISNLEGKKQHIA